MALNTLCCILYCQVLVLCALECFGINKKHFSATENTKCAIRPKYECVARPGNASEFYFHFIYTNSKLIIKETRWEAGIEL